MMKHTGILVLSAIALLTASCGKDFEIEGGMPVPKLTMSVEYSKYNLNFSDDDTEYIEGNSSTAEMRQGDEVTMRAGYNYDGGGKPRWVATGDAIEIAPDDYDGGSCAVKAVKEGTSKLTVSVGNQSVTLKINVTSPLQASFKYDNSNYFEVTFDITETPTRYKSFVWDFGDGTVHSQYSSVRYTYSNGGTYNVKLTLTSASGETSSVSQMVTVYEYYSAPEASFNFTIDGLEFYATNKTVGAQSYYWDFGDGTYSTAKSVNHVYSRAGNYTVTLTARNKYGSTTASTGSRTYR